MHYLLLNVFTINLMRQGLMVFFDARRYMVEITFLLVCYSFR